MLYCRSSALSHLFQYLRLLDEIRRIFDWLIVTFVFDQLTGVDFSLWGTENFVSSDIFLAQTKPLLVLESIGRFEIWFFQYKWFLRIENNF